MSTQTFTWSTRVGTNGSVQFRTRKAQFGDGYSQEVKDGLNNKINSWPISLVVKESDASAIVSFLDSHAGNTSFYWTPPLGTQGLYRCNGYNVSAMGGDAYTISATFQEVFSP